MSEEFKDPNLAITKVYTKTGDKGRTALVGGQRVAKHHGRIEAYGTVDELNAFVGATHQTIEETFPESADKDWFAAVLVRIQHELFNLGSILATLPDDVHPQQPRIRDQDISQMEADIDKVNDDLPTLRSFVLPGGSRANTDLHVCRTVCRRAERLLTALSESEDIDGPSLRYLNRLSDAFFVWSRWVMKVLNQEEVLWQPNKAGKGST